MVRKILIPYASLKLMKPETLAESIAEENNMTKSEKEQLKKECEAGMHACSYDHLVKHIEKGEKRKLMRLRKKIRKLVLEQIAGMKAELESKNAENESLKAENTELKSRKDLNSDVPSDREEKLMAENESLKAENNALKARMSRLEAAVKKLAVSAKAPKAEDEIYAGLADEALALGEESIAEDFREWDVELKARERSIEGVKADLASIEKECGTAGSAKPEALKPGTPKPAQAADFPADNSDVPEDEPGPAEFQAKMQMFVSKRYIGIAEAENISSFMPFKVELKAPLDGFGPDDREEHAPERLQIAKWLFESFRAFKENAKASGAVMRLWNSAWVFRKRVA